MERDLPVPLPPGLRFLPLHGPPFILSVGDVKGITAELYSEHFSGSDGEVIELYIPNLLTMRFLPGIRLVP